MFSVGWSEVLEQFNFVAVTLQNGDRDVRTRNSGGFTGEITRMMCPMGKLKAENILPKGQRPLKIRNGDASVIRRKDSKWSSTHDN